MSHRQYDNHKIVSNYTVYKKILNNNATICGYGCCYLNPQKAEYPTRRPRNDRYKSARRGRCGGCK